jgi:sulfoxide reductase catalytic subunit YedY
MFRYKKNSDYQDLAATPQWAYLKRRHLIQGGAVGLLSWWAARAAQAADLFKAKTNPEFAKVESPRALSKQELFESYNNFYEFSLEKDGVVPKVKDWKIDSWKLEVGGLCKKPRTLSLSDLSSVFPLEERIYRFRCVEAWSMVVPWVGFPLAKLIESVEPKSEAKFVKFTSLADKAAMPGIKELDNYPWPYTEGLRLDEAMNPLALMAVGAYGGPLKKQNGAPIRLVLPWKYGFKSAKSLVKIELVKEQPKGLWEVLAAKEYGFYANVNPKVDHPRWTQASERVIDGSFFPKRIPTLPFNGYEKQVAALYSGLDLTKNY